MSHFLRICTYLSSWFRNSQCDIAWTKHVFETLRIRALDKREYLMIVWDNFCEFCIKTYVVTSHLNRLDETVQMRGHNIWFQ